MARSIKYKTGDREEYTMETMVDRVIYWWVRYEGKRTEGGKEFSKSDIHELSDRLKYLAERPIAFKFNKPDMMESDDVLLGVTE